MYQSEGPALSASTRDLLQQSLLSGLQDDSWAVASAAAGAAGLVQLLPPAELLPALRQLLQRVYVALRAKVSAQEGSKGITREALKAGKRALRVAADVVNGAEAGESAAAGAAAGLLLDYVLADEQVAKLARSAVAAASQVEREPLLAAVAGAGEAAAGNGAAVVTPVSDKQGKKQKKGSATAAPAATGEDGDKQQQKRIAPEVFNQQVVDTLAAVLSTTVEAVARAQDVAGHCGVRGQHVLLLAVQKALLGSSAAAAGGGGGKGGKKGSNSSSSTQEQLQVALVQCLLELLHLQIGASKDVTPPAEGTAALGWKSTAAAELPADWQQMSEGLVLDDTYLPSKQHMLKLGSSSSNGKLHGALLLHVLYQALEQQPAAVWRAAVGSPQQLFALLATGQTPLLPTPTAAALQGSVATAAGGAVGLSGSVRAAVEALLPHLQLLVHKAAAPGQWLGFLSEFYGLPGGVLGGSFLPGAALKVLAAELASFTAATPSAVAAGKEQGITWLLRLFAAVGSRNYSVRKAAVKALFAVRPVLLSKDTVTQQLLGWGVASSSSGSSSSSVQGLKPGELAQVLQALEPHRQLLEANSSGIVSLLQGAVGAAAAGGGSGSGGRGGRGKVGGRGSRGGAAVSAAGGGGSSSQQQLQLPEQVVKGLELLFLGQLPQLKDLGDLAAVEFVASVCLSGTTGEGQEQQTAVAAAVLPCATALLQQLVQLQPQASAPAAAAAVGGDFTGPVVAFQGPLSPEAVEAMGQQLQQAVLQLLPVLVSPAAALGTPDAMDLLLELLTLEQHGLEQAGGAAVPGASGLLPSPTQLGAALVAPVRAVAFQGVGPELFVGLGEGQKVAVLRALMLASSGDADRACREAARGALERLPLGVSTLLPLIEKLSAGAAAAAGGGSGGFGTTGAAAADAPGSSRKESKRKRQKTGAADGGGATAMDVDEQQQQEKLQLQPEDLAVATAALELLQWKEDVQQQQQLVVPLQVLLSALLPLLGSIAEVHREEVKPVGLFPGTTSAADSAEPAEEGDEESSAEVGGAGGVLSPPAVGYAGQLVLLVLTRLAKLPAAAAGGGEFDMGLVLRCAREAPDGAVRNAALVLLGELARRSPEQMLVHVLEVSAVGCTGWGLHPGDRKGVGWVRGSD